MILVAVGVDGCLRGGLVLDKCADDAERSEAEVFEGARLGGCVEEGVEEERDVCYWWSVAVVWMLLVK